MVEKRGIKYTGILGLLAAALVFLVLSAILLYDSAPIIEKITLHPEILYSGYNIRADIIVYDFDDKILGADFVWLKNNKSIFREIKKGESGKPSYSILNSENFSKGDIIDLEVYLSDGKKESKHQRAGMAVQNSPPEPPVLIKPLDYAVSEKGGVEFEYASTDRDNDNLTYTLYINDAAENSTSKEKIRLFLKDGEYTWKVSSSDNINTTLSGLYHLKIGEKKPKKLQKPVKKGQNKAPELIRNLSNQSWGIFEFNLNAFNLNNYFKDEDNEQLEFDVEGNDNITVFITNDGRVSFIQPHEWYGTERVVFTAADGIAKVRSNLVELNVGKIKPRSRDISLCPGPCCGISCGRMAKNCSDGSISTCEMDCFKGKCIPCSPSCGELYPPSRINLPLFSGGAVIDGLPCIDLGVTEKEKRVTTKDAGFLKEQLPEGYSVITGPFSLDCYGKMDVTLNIPSNYEDVKALRCRDELCYPAFLRHTSELKCGGEIIRKTLRDELYLKPELMPIRIKEQTSDQKKSIILPDKKIRIALHGDSEDSGVSLRMPAKPVKEAANPSLKIVTTPLILRFEGSSSPDVNISLPYFISEKIAEDSLSFYTRKGEEWLPLGGRINKKERVVESDISDIMQYANENNEVTLAIIGVIMDANFTSSFTKEYEPLELPSQQPQKGSQESRDMIVLVHGLASGPATFQELVDDIKLTNQPYYVYSLGYSSYKPINETANELKEYLELNSKQYDNIYIIAHSMGSLIAQKALYDAYIGNKKDETRYSFIGRVKKAILASSINEGSPAVEFYYDLFSYLVNQDSPFTLYELNSAIIKELAQGMAVPRVPSVKYYAVAGTKTYPFFKRLSKITGDIFNNEPNDGIVTVKNAQHIGNSYLDRLCENYWEFNLTHTELIDDEASRRVILSIIAEDKFSGESASIGNNRYFELNIGDCSKEDSFIVIGKKLEPQPTHKIFCGGCGDGYCSTKESLISCPSDCIKIPGSRKAAMYAILIIAGSSVFSLFFILRNRRSKKIKGVRNKRWLEPKRNPGSEENSGRLSFILLRETIRRLKGRYSDGEIVRILLTMGWRKELIERAMALERKKEGFTYFGFRE